VGVLATDLLVGVVIGIVVKIVIHLLNGVPVRSMFKPYLLVETQADGSTVIRARDSAVFSNWIPFKRQIEQLGLLQHSNLTVDLSETKLVDHSVMEKLHELQDEFKHEGLRLELTGLESHLKFSEHEASARRRDLSRIRRITIVIEESRSDEITSELMSLGASSYTLVECHAAGRGPRPETRDRLVRLEMLVDFEKFDVLIGYLRKQVQSNFPIVVSTETVEVVYPPRVRSTPHADAGSEQHENQYQSG
jgi:hypothetical protein